MQTLDPKTIRDTQFPQTAVPGVDSEDFPSELYYIYDEKIFIVPNPNSTLTFDLDYWQTLPALADPGQLTDFFTINYRPALKWGALAEAYYFLHEETRGNSAEARFQTLLGEAIRNDIQIQNSGPPRSRGV